MREDRRAEREWQAATDCGGWLTGHKRRRSEGYWLWAVKQQGK